MRIPLLALIGLASLPVSLLALDGVPLLTQAIDPVTAPVSHEPVKIDLSTHFGISGVTGNLVQIETNRGTINMELYADTAPLTVDNFLNYITSKRYDGTLVHRSIPGFVIQGGGYKLPTPLTSILRDGEVTNEFSRSNVRGTVAMARVGGQVNSATSEWFINLTDNSGAPNNLDSVDEGYTVFARVLGTGMSVADNIAALSRVNAGNGFTDVPVTNGGNAVTSANAVLVNTVREAVIYPDSTDAPSLINFNATTSNGTVVTTRIRNSRLILEFPSPPAGNATVTVTATDANGNSANSTFAVTVPRGPSRNNAFASAITLNGTTDSRTNRSVGATKESGEPNHAGNAGGASLWYRWTAPQSGLVQIATDGSSFDTLLAVYTGNAVNALTPVVANDNFEGSQTSSVAFQAVTGTEYRIAVDGHDGASGSVNISLHYLAATEPVAGLYQGALTGDEPVHLLTGFLRMQMNSNGAFSAQLEAGQKTLRFSGGFRADGSYSRKFSGDPGFEVQLQLVSGGMTGVVYAGDYGGSINADWISLETPGTVAPGRYTFSIAAAQDPASGNGTTGNGTTGNTTVDTVPGPPTVPEGNGYATVLVRSSGMAVVAGRLGDDEPFSVSAPVTSQGRFPLGVRLRGGREMAVGMLSFTTANGSVTVGGQMDWTKHPTGDDRFFAAGFAERLAVTGSDYVVPAHGERVIHLVEKPGNVEFAVSGGNLRLQVETQIGTMRRDNTVRGIDGLEFDFDRATGLFGGRFYDPGAFSTRAYGGVMVRGIDTGLGTFSGELGTGSVRLSGASAVQPAQ